MPPEPKAARRLTSDRIPELSNLPDADRVYAEILVALVASQRSAEEMAEAVAVLNPMIEARARFVREGQDEIVARLDEIALKIRRAAQGAESATSGMGVDLALDYLRLAFDEARSLIA